MQFKSLAFAFFVIACGGQTIITPPAATDYASGTRLRARVYSAGADGALLFHDWYDTQLSAECELMTAEDGVVRCVPTEARLEGEFADPQCHQPVYVANTSCTMPAFAYEPSGCTHAAYALGDVRASSVVYVKSASGDCITEDVSGLEVHLLAKVDPATLVAATETREPRDPSLSMRFLHADDGSFQALGAYDEGLGGPCASTIDAPSSSPLAGRCLPTTAVHGSEEFSDAACGAGLAALDPQACTPPNAWVDWEPTACDTVPVRVAKLGAPYSGIRWAMIDNACTVVPQTTGSYVQLGGDVDVPSVGVSDQGTGRIRARVQTTATGDALFTKSFFDTSLSVTCTAGLASDGKLRCLPAAVDVGNGPFLDAACTTPLVQADASCTEPPKVARIFADGTCGASQTQYFKVGPAIDSTTPVYAHFSSDHCSGPFTMTSALYTTTPLAASDLAELTEVTQ